MKYIEIDILLYDNEELQKMEVLGMEDKVAAIAVKTKIFIDHIGAFAPNDDGTVEIWSSSFGGSTKALITERELIHRIKNAKGL